MRKNPQALYIAHMAGSGPPVTSRFRRASTVALKPSRVRAPRRLRSPGRAKTTSEVGWGDGADRTSNDADVSIALPTSTPGSHPETLGGERPRCFIVVRSTPRARAASRGCPSRLRAPSGCGRRRGRGSRLTPAGAGRHRTVPRVRQGRRRAAHCRARAPLLGWGCDRGVV